MRQAARSLSRRPGFTLAALVTLGLGIGANSTVFSIVNALLLRPLPLGEHGARIVTLHSTHKTQPEDWEDSNLSYADLRDVRARAGGLQDVAGYIGRGFTLQAGGESERLRGGSVTPNLFALLGLRPVLGRDFREEDAADFGFEPVVLLSHQLFERRFGADPQIVGRSLVLNGRAITVIGVMPPGIRFPERDEFWVAYRPSADPEAARAQRFVAGFGLLRDGASIGRVQGELDLVARQLAEAHPDTNRGWGVRALSFRDSVVDRGLRVVAAALLGAVAAVLLIACANLACLNLARGASRQRELAVRASLGASRGPPGAADARRDRAAVRGWRRSSAWWPPPGSPISWCRPGPSSCRTGSTSASTGASCCSRPASRRRRRYSAGLLPAWRSSRLDLVSDLRDGVRSGTGAGAQRLQSALVVGQVALSLALLVGASLMIRSFLKLQAAPSGFVEEALLTLRFYVAGDAYDPLEKRAGLLRDLEQRLSALPGVKAAAFTSSIPTDDGGAPVRLVIERHPVPRRGGAVGAPHRGLARSLRDAGSAARRGAQRSRRTSTPRLRPTWSSSTGRWRGASGRRERSGSGWRSSTAADGPTVSRSAGCASWA